MDRRSFLGTLAGGLLTPPLAAGAQQVGRRVATVGLLGDDDALFRQVEVEALRAALRELGYEEGRTLSIAYRWSVRKRDRLARLAEELVRLPVDVIVTYGTPAIEAAKHATSTVPIVFAEVGDALSIEGGTTLARPVRNLTGSSFLFPELAAKRLELLKQALPATTRVAVLVDPS